MKILSENIFYMDILILNTFRKKKNQSNLFYHPNLKQHMFHFKEAKNVSLNGIVPHHFVQ